MLAHEPFLIKLKYDVRILCILQLKKFSQHMFVEFGPEASLRMVAPGAGFRGGTLYRPKYR